MTWFEENEEKLKGYKFEIWFLKDTYKDSDINNIIIINPNADYSLYTFIWHTDFALFLRNGPFISNERLIVKTFNQSHYGCNELFKDRVKLLEFNI
jgi:hypothetical protein